MTPETTQTEKKFVPVTDSKEIVALLKEGAKDLSLTTIWTKDQSFSLAGRLCRACHIDQVIDVTPPKVSVGPHPDPQTELYFSLQISRAFLFFRSQLFRIDPTVIKYHLPKTLYRVESRKHPRFTLPENAPLRLNLQDPQVEKRDQARKIIDISAGGLSFFAPPDLGAELASKKILEALSFTLNGKTYTTRAEIRYRKEWSHVVYKNGYRVGMMFLDLPAEDARALDSFVAGEIKKYPQR